jgi:hypothetical protein
MNLEGKHIVVIAANYIYEGILADDTPDALHLREPSIIYATGPWSQQSWQRAERLPIPVLRIERSAVEAFGELDRTMLTSGGKR